MKSVYVGKAGNKVGSFEMCLVINSDIQTANALVYNIAKNTIEVLPFGCWHRQAKVFQEIAEENRHTWEAKYQRQLEKYAAFIADFEATAI